MTKLTDVLGYNHLDRALDMGMDFMNPEKNQYRKITKEVDDRLNITICTYYREYASEINECDNVTIMVANKKGYDMHYAIDIYRTHVCVSFTSLQDVESNILIDHSTELTEEWFFQLSLLYDLTGISYEQYKKMVYISKFIEMDEL